MWLLASSVMFVPVCWCHVQYKIVLYYCSLSEVGSVAFIQFCNVLILFSCVILSIRSHLLTILVCLRRQCGFQPVLECLFLSSGVMLSIRSFFNIEVHLR